MDYSIYRCWSSFHARRALVHLDEVLPETLFGSRPGRHATQIWAKLLWTIEESFVDAVPLTGVVADLAKAFNFLPRLVVMELAAHMGIPGYVLVAWAGALSDMKRRFQLRDAVTPGVTSVTGVPEGCGLSCVAMVLVDVCFHKWMEVFFPLCTPVSFVDDWQLVTCHPTLLNGAVECMKRFVEAMDLQLDAKKEYAWSLCADGRKLLRSQDFSVVLGAKNLGAHVQFARKHSNAALTDRMMSMNEVWPRLKLSASSFSSKVHALVTAAWPRAMHAIAATAVSDAAFHKLRTGATKGLDIDKAGANAWIQLGLIEKSHVDPQCWAITQTIRCVRECGQASVVRGKLLQMVSGVEGPPANSFTTTPLARIQMLGWSVLPNGNLLDQIGEFCLFRTCMAELNVRISWAWQHVVAQQVAHRPGLVQLQYADVGDTRSWLSHLSYPDQELFKKCLDGCHITQDSKVHCQESGTDRCPYCQCTDSRFHRFWVCEYFAEAREGISPDQWALIAAAPEFLTCYGWSLRPYTVLQWMATLNAIPQPPEIHVSSCSGTLNLFTDGSCLNQHDPLCRVATWAVVYAGQSFSQAGVLDSGPLPGVLQSAYRAEVFAILRALRLAKNHGSSIMLWTDCAAVVRKLRRCLRGHPPKPNSAHADLWGSVFDCLSEFFPGQVAVTKVAAHQGFSNVQSPIEEWCVFHNHLADRAALYAQMQRPVDFWPFYAKHVSAVTASRDLSRTVQRVLLAISQKVMRDDDAETEQVRDEVCQTPPVPLHAHRTLPVLSIPGAAVRWYGDEVVRVVLSWYWQNVYGSTFPYVWLSQFQLYVDFMLSGGVGPIKFPQWQAGHNIPELDLLQLPFQKRTRWFCKVLKESLKHLGVGYSYMFVRPSSSALFLHTGCLAVKWDPRRIEAADQWILQHVPQGIHRTSRAIDLLPCAAKHSEFPPIWVTGS